MNEKVEKSSTEDRASLKGSVKRDQLEMMIVKGKSAMREQIGTTMTSGDLKSCQKSTPRNGWKKKNRRKRGEGSNKNSKEEELKRGRGEKIKEEKETWRRKGRRKEKGERKEK